MSDDDGVDSILERLAFFLEVSQFEEGYQLAVAELAKDPDAFFAHFFAGVFASNLGKSSSTVLKHLKDARSLEPENAYVHFEIALVFHELGKNDAALESVTKAVELDPTESSFWVQKAWSEYKSNQKQCALLSAEKAVELDASGIEARDAWIWMRFDRGMISSDEAVSGYEDILAEDAENSLIHHRLGYLKLVHVDDFDGARSFFETAAAVDPRGLNISNYQNLVTLEDDGFRFLIMPLAYLKQENENWGKYIFRTLFLFLAGGVFWLSSLGIGLGNWELIWGIPSLAFLAAGWALLMMRYYLSLLRKAGEIAAVSPGSKKVFFLQSYAALMMITGYIVIVIAMFFVPQIVTGGLVLGIALYGGIVKR
ncbi:MAG: hypothetical protein AAF226_00705 [Verrucomicrobiota bacterium]